MQYTLNFRKRELNYMHENVYPLQRDILDAAFTNENRSKHPRIISKRRPAFALDIFLQIPRLPAIRKLIFKVGSTVSIGAD